MNSREAHQYTNIHSAHGLSESVRFLRSARDNGRHNFCLDKVREDIETVLSTAGDKQCEIAFFGGSFTGIERGLMTDLLDIAQEYVDAGRVSGIRMSTRPDYISPEITEILHRYTVSQVELGIQSFSDSVLSACKRGHTAQASYSACRLLKAEGFSFGGQMMTGLPGSTFECEKETAEIICDLGADSTRIYPCIVFRNTPLELMTKRGEYVPMNVDEAVERSAGVYRVFLDRGVKCLKIGLHESENLHDTSVYYAGPNHPAMGELVRSKIYLENILASLEGTDASGKTLYVSVAPGAASLASGQRRVNKERIMQKTGAKCVKILENNSYAGYNISINIK